MCLPTYGITESKFRFYDLELEAALILQKQEERGFTLMSLLHGRLHRLSKKNFDRLVKYFNTAPFVAGPSFTSTDLIKQEVGYTIHPTT